MKIHFVTNFNIFTKFLNHKNLELYGIHVVNELDRCTYVEHLLCIMLSD